MSINLSFYLDKNKLSLSKFCTRMNFTSYNDIVEYCKNKKFNCDIKESETAELFIVKVPEVVKKEVKDEPEKPKTRRRGRKPKTKKAGTSDKKSDS